MTGSVAEAVGATLAALGAEHVFGVVGSGNFHVTNALVKHGVKFVACRHEGGAATAADAYARISGRPGIVTVHQGPGLTNAMTGITEAAKSRTPMLVLAAEATAPRSNFRIDQGALAHAVGASSVRVHEAADVARAWHLAVSERRTVLVNLPLDIQAMPAGEMVTPSFPPVPRSVSESSIVELNAVLDQAERPVFIAGRGALGARAELSALAERCGALLATSAAAKGLFTGDPWNLDVSGGFATPLAASLIRAADVVVAWGASLNMWTTRHGGLVDRSATVVQVDLDPSAFGAHHRVDLSIAGDVAETAAAVTVAEKQGYRSDPVRLELSTSGRWRDVAYEDEGDGSHIDARTATIAVDDILPSERVVAVDSGNFMGYPSMFLSVPDHRGFSFTQAFQSIGLGLASAIGAAFAMPDRLPVAACGDGGFLMGISELDTVRRLGLGMLILVYNDDAYGAEVHHFGPGGHPLSTVVFPSTDIAAIARGHGCAAATVRRREDLASVEQWVAGPRDVPMVVDLKVAGQRPSWWLEEAFRGH
ncbi:thiamine pyrophosphate-binding protein [Actinoplanes sp. TBRC 11911]|uniref:thiamine pyrophosphate-binding protein n=1 Tax=Actinoplanes sp. TBRC 11911 TaxID=2729386 RepID=UPI00145F7C5E|nr:thiamine pyrophosphate-binding protein [Actinoplanes sp. TBRC 11911]NMO52437.1 thiamine pyrophosphate-binding protein [Actinoplanes sp. TBRC 11911]